jgi:hypothetical protein
MENFSPLQQPGGLGPVPELKPIGMSMANPSTYLNDEISIRARQTQTLDNVNRVFHQYNIDHGSYLRTPVSPVEYGIGNVVKSNEVTGPAGYNHKEMPMPLRPEDMPRESYVMQEANKYDPTMRLNVAALSILPQQNFYDVTTADSKMPLRDYRMADNLSLQQQVLGGGDAS